MAEKALSLAVMGRFAEAFPLFEEALKLDPDCYEAHLNKATALFSMGDYKHGLESAEFARKIRPRRSHPLFYRGKCLAALGRHEEALTAYDCGLAMDAPHPRFHYERGRCLISLNRFEEASVSFGEWLKYAPNDVKGSMERSAALGAAGHYHESIECADGMLSTFSNPAIRAFALDAKALSFGHLGRLHEGIASVNEGIALLPKESFLHETKGWLLQKLGRYIEAVESFDVAFRLDTSNKAAVQGKAEVLVILMRNMIW